MPPSNCPPTTTPPSRSSPAVPLTPNPWPLIPAVIRLLALLAALVLAFTCTAVAAAPNPVVRDRQQETAEPALPVPALTAHPSAAAVQLRWSEIPGAARYELWTWSNEEAGWQLVSATLTGAAYTHADLDAGTTHYYAIRALDAGTTHYYAIRALDAAGQPVSAWSQNVPATLPAAQLDQSQLPASTPTPTSTPTPLQARAQSTTAAPRLTARPAPAAVQLSWPELTGAAAYELWTWWDRETGWQFISDTLTGAGFTHTELSPGTTYYYALRALDAAGQPLTGWSDYASAIPLPATANTSTPTPTPTSTPTPASDQAPAPTPTATTTPIPTPTPTPTTSSLPAQELSAPDLTAQPAPGEVRLTWSEVPRAARYELWTWWDRDTGWQYISDTLTGASFTHTELSSGTTYYYALRALDTGGSAGPWSEYASAAPLPASAVQPTLTLTSTPAPALTPTPTATPSPTASPAEQLPPPPSSLDLDPYYRKYLDAGGIPVVASADVDDHHLYHARDIMNAMLSNRPDLRATMAANRFRVVIYKHDGCRGPFQTLELRNELPLGRCTTTVGTATIRWLQNRFTGEVLLIIDVVGTAPAVRQPYCNVILVHEFAHMVHYALAIETALSGNRPLFDSPFDSRLRGLYNAAISAGLYPDAYAATNYKEYWAEAVMFWFLPDMLTGKVRTPAAVSQLADYDPGAAALVAETFRAAALPHCEPIYFRVRGKVTGPAGRPLAGITVSADLRVRTASDRFGYKSARHALPTAEDGAYLLSISRPYLASLQRRVRQETGVNDLDTFFLLALARRQWDHPTGCPAGYLAPAGQVQNVAPQNAARFPLPQSDLTGITLPTAPNFTWTPRLAC